jgi:hypothetical protein
MQDKKWVRIGLAAVIVGGAVGAGSMVGCSGDDNGGGGGPDAGNDHSVADAPSGSDSPIGSDTGTHDSSSGEGGEAGPSTPNAKVYIVNAAVDPNAPPFRFCFGLDQSANHDGSNVTIAGGIAPVPDFNVPPFPIPGLFPGFGASATSSPTLASFPLATLSVALFAVNAASVANDTVDGGPDGGAELACEKVIGSDAKGKAGSGGGYLTLGTDYWYVGTIPSGTLAKGSTWVASLTGCVPGETGAAAAFCGANYDATKGNLGLVAAQLDNTTVVAADAGIGAQFVLASPAWDGVVMGPAALGGLGGAGTVAGFLLPNTATPSDAGSDAEAGPPASPFVPFPITGATPAKTGTTVYPTKLATVSGATFDTTTAFFAQAVTDAGTTFVPPGCDPTAGSCAGILPMSTIAQLSGGTFTNGKGYAFILVGDPTAAPFLDGGTFNSKFVHFLAFPTSNP